MVRRLASLACALLFAAISLPVLAKEREALVIGNGQYQGLPSRPQSVADAAAVADMLRKIGFEVSESANLDRNGMRNALAQFRARLGDARIVVLFYSGGAVQAGGRSFLLPVDASRSATTDLSALATEVNPALGSMTAADRSILAFFDIDRDNPFRIAAPAPGMTPGQNAGTLLIMYATRPGQRLLPATDRHSPFTATLLKHLPTPGLKLGSAAQLIRADVMAATERRQIPWDHSAGAGQLILVPGERKP